MATQVRKCTICCHFISFPSSILEPFITALDVLQGIDATSSKVYSNLSEPFGARN